MTSISNSPISTRAATQPNGPRPVRAPRGTQLSCKTWQAEAAMRMLMNNLDPEVAEDPDHLIVYGGRGQAARSWEAFDAIVDCLKRLEADETLLVQSGKPVGVVRTHVDSPRVLIANSNLVPHWATQAHFDELAAKGLMMYGQMTAGSWIYIGTQGILQGTYETFSECARQHFGGTLAGRLCVTAGCGGMGGAQPLAVTMNGGTCLIADVRMDRLEKRVKDRYLDVIDRDLDTVIQRALDAKAEKRAISIGWLGNGADLLHTLWQREIIPDVITDQTSAHDPLNGYVPAGFPEYDEDGSFQSTPQHPPVWNEQSYEAWAQVRAKDPESYVAASYGTMADHVGCMLQLQEQGAIVFDYGNNIRQRAKEAWEQGRFYAGSPSDLALLNDPNPFRIPGFVPAYIRPQFCLGRGPFRWAALSGDEQDIYTIDDELLKLFPQDESLHRWLKLARERVAFQGLPARICWLGLGQRDKAGLLFNDLVRDGKVKAPIVIGRDHLDCGSVASPNRETEAMKDGSDAVSDWAILNALVNTASGASWVSFHHGGGVGIGYSQHAGQVIVADGTEDAARRLERVLTNDPAMGVLRHADAGYEEAARCAGEEGLRIPMG